MASPEPVSLPAPDASAFSLVKPEAEQKRLWFEYIKTLNQRRSESAERVGLTSYLLFAVLAGMAYRFLPRLPVFLAKPGNVVAALTIFILESNIIIFVGMACSATAAYCTGGRECRFYPEHWRRATQLITLPASTLAIAGLAVAPIADLVVLANPRLWLKVTLAGLAIFWAASLAFSLWREIRAIWRSVRYRVPIPRSTALQIDASLGTTAAVDVTSGTFAVLCGFVVLIYSGSLSSGWTGPWKAASVALVFLVLSVEVMSRWVSSIGEANYLALERDLVLNDLSVDSIRRRFVEELIGLDAFQWLDHVLGELKGSNDKVGESYRWARALLQEIRELPPARSEERENKAKQLVDRLCNGIENRTIELGQFEFRLGLFVEEHLRPRDREALQRWLQDCHREAERARELTREGEAVTSECQALLAGVVVPSISLQPGDPRG
jgi:hypothetical protein